MLVSELISASLRKIGGVSSGNAVDANRQAEALLALKSMLRSWGAVSAFIFASVHESKALTAGQATYTWGVGGDINTLRPNMVVGAYILDSSGVSHPVDVMIGEAYDNIAVKSTSNRPYMLSFLTEYPLDKLVLYPVPSEAETIYIESLKPFTETGSFGLVTDTISFPNYYEEAIVYNLAIRLAPEFGRTISAEVAMIADSSLNVIRNVNSANNITPVFIKVPASTPYGAGYSVNSDSYR